MKHIAAFFTGNFHTERTRVVAEMLSETMGDPNVCTRLYSGTDSSSFLKTLSSTDMETDSNYYSLFSYSNYESVELITIASAGIQHGHAAVDIHELVSRLPRVPIILLEDDTLLPETPGSIFITADNYGGTKKMTTILIEEYGCKNICFLSGPLFHKESLKRLTGWRDAMMEHGLSASSEHIAYGTFTEWIDKQVELFFAEGKCPDAILCASDEMAKGVYRVARKRDLKVGKDLLVAGFGDTMEAETMDPPLSSIRLDYKELVRVTAEQTHLFFEGKEMTSCQIPAEVILRGSVTGKVSSEEMSGEEETVTVTRSKLAEIRLEGEQKNLFCTMLMRRLLDSSGFESFFRKLGEELSSIGTKRSYVLLLKEPQELEDREILTAPDEVRLVMDQRGKFVTSFTDEEAPYVPKAGISEYFGNDQPGNTVNYMLFYGNVQFGLFSVETGPEEVPFYYSLSMVIGSGLRYLFLFMEQKKMHKFMEEKNLVLGYAANHDALTGLLNRSGVMNYITGFAHRAPENSVFVAVVADLDHLKQINDNFGHDGGDTALRSAAQLLSHTLPKDSPIGRTGGDEFTGCFLMTPDFTEEVFMDRLQELMDKCNSIWDLPFYVELSIGMKTFTLEDTTDMVRILKEADENLYEDKAKRRASVLKE